MIKPIERYRPEAPLHEDGPVPKWLEKHGGGIHLVECYMDDHRNNKHLLTSLLFQLARRWHN